MFSNLRFCYKLNIGMCIYTSKPFTIHIDIHLLHFAVTRDACRDDILVIGSTVGYPVQA